MTTGAPTHCTPDVTAMVCTALTQGAGYVAASASGGIGYATFKRWMVDGAKGREPYATFRAKVKAACGLGEAALLRSIHDAGYETGDEKRNWPAHAWLLERRYPNRWGRRDRVNVDAKVTTVGAPRTAEEVRAQLAALAAAVMMPEDE